MAVQTELKSRWGVDHPIVQAPMAGGATTSSLTAAACNAGALGFIAAAYLSPDQIADTSREVRKRTDRPFGVNLFAPVPLSAPPVDSGPALERLAPFHVELGLPLPELPIQTPDRFPDQLDAALESGASVFSFTFGVLPPEAVSRIKAKGMFLMGTATTVEEALRLEDAGVDAVVAQGSEAGAHRGTFAASFESAMVGAMALVPQIVDAVQVPVVASGGIMDGRGIAAALALGAGAVQMGTAFLTCDEAGIPESYRSAILDGREDGTRVTRAFSGRPARGLVNRCMDELEGMPDAILPYPLQNALTRPLRNAAANQDRSEFLSLWAGQGIRMARRQSTATLIARLVRETDEAIDRLASLRRG